MNRIAFISAFTVLLMSACSKPEPAPSMEQFDKYIFFSQNVHTKASLIESTADMNGKQFGVVGFKYDDAHSWESIKTSATPDVFTTNPQAVTCDANGYGSYSPLQGWSNSKKYTFFAFYPMVNDYVALANLDGRTPYTAGIPAIKYSLDPSTADNFKASMIDVMTASYQEDRYWNSASDNNIVNGEVAFGFTHCLSCLGINLKNSSSGSITVTAIRFEVSNIQHAEITIPLNGDAYDIIKPILNTPLSAALYLDLPKNGQDLAASGSVEVEDKFIFIPQSMEISINLSIVYKRESTGNESNYEVTEGLSTVLSEGNKHIINLNFKDSTVEVSSDVTTNEWVVIPDVDNTFN